MSTLLGGLCWPWKAGQKALPLRAVQLLLATGPSGYLPRSLGISSYRGATFGIQNLSCFYLNTNLFLSPVSGTIKLLVFRFHVQTGLLSVSHSPKPKEDYRKKTNLIWKVWDQTMEKVCPKMNYSYYKAYLKQVYSENCEKLAHYSVLRKSEM